MAGLDSVKTTVLLVEDNPDTKRLFTKILEHAGYEPIPTPDSQVAYQMAIDLLPDIIVTDALMPLRDGFELTYLLKNDERTSHIPVILLTALPKKYEGLANLAKADQYLNKPCTPEDLVSTVAEVLKRRRKTDTP